MSFKIAQRNFEKVQHEGLRKVVDQRFSSSHDELSIVYYDHWKKGDYSVGFQGYKPNQGDTPAQAKALFDKLHGLIFDIHELALDEENSKKPQAERDSRLEENMKRILEGETKTSKEKIQEKVQQASAEGFNLVI